jgi:hypothetical protein
MSKVHWPKWNGILGDTLCGRNVEFASVAGNVRFRVTCKQCRKLDRLRRR